MNKSVGIIKEIDALGRLVIPKEIRTLFKMGMEVELVITEEGVLVRNPKYELVERKAEDNIS